MPAKHFPVGIPVHNEMEPIAFLVERLPHNYHVISNVELREPGQRATKEHDVVVLAPHGVYTLDLKSWRGRVEGNRDRWVVDGRETLRSPVQSQKMAARRLKGLLVEKEDALRKVWVEGGVFMTAQDVVLDLGEYAEGVVWTRENVISFLTRPVGGTGGRVLSGEQRQQILDVLLDRRPNTSMGLASAASNHTLDTSPDFASNWEDTKVTTDRAAKDGPMEDEFVCHQCGVDCQTFEALLDHSCAADPESPLPGWPADLPWDLHLLLRFRPDAVLLEQAASALAPGGRAPGDQRTALALAVIAIKLRNRRMLEMANLVLQDSEVTHRLNYVPRPGERPSGLSGTSHGAMGIDTVWDHLSSSVVAKLGPEPWRCWGKDAMDGREADFWSSLVFLAVLVFLLTIFW